ncbi:MULTISPECIES: type II toxin-antitoxin system VapC family toxin [unclassified Kribbella]|uniref:type II toxin-antitoxin system VapC family toxin n=1 Tax=unclassified Kribbella TaxID=2644121 RepID=UPI003016CD07
MIVLDTDVISELMKESPDTAVWQWLHDNLGEELYTTAITAAEIHNGIEQLPAGRLRKQVREAAGGIFALVQDEVLSFTAEAAMAYPVVMTDRRRAGLPIAPLDAQIAAICLVEEAALATRNTKDFVKTGVELLNPWE